MSGEIVNGLLAGVAVNYIAPELTEAQKLALLPKVTAGGGVGITFGCDPEFFFTDKSTKMVVGAEKILPEGGSLRVPYDKTGRYTDPVAYPDIGKIIVDGVQGELNVTPTGCRASLSNYMQRCFQDLKEHLKNHPEIECSFVGMVDVEPEYLNSLSDKAKEFGCAPSLNAYRPNAEVGVSGSTYYKRAAGGHLHLGISPSYKFIDTVEKQQKFIKILDAFVGNTCVMLDRDENQKLRRLHYGRAGEYRLPSYGIEYRTLSNFWMRNYRLMSLVMGLSRLAAYTMYSGIRTIAPRPAKPSNWTDKQYEEYYPASNYVQWNGEEELWKYMDSEKVEKAINENDLELAKENYYGVDGRGGLREFIRKHTTTTPGHSNGLNSYCLTAFDYFLNEVWEKGLEGVFPGDAFEHWCTKEEGHQEGWELFIQRRQERGLILSAIPFTPRVVGEFVPEVEALKVEETPTIKERMSIELAKPEVKKILKKARKTPATKGKKVPTTKKKVVTKKLKAKTTPKTKRVLKKVVAKVKRTPVMDRFRRFWAESDSMIVDECGF